jgi:cephalosporin hydroxylase
MNNKEFFERNKSVIENLGKDKAAAELTRKWFEHVSKFEYSYHFTWMGIPIIQFPQDVMAIQEIIWSVKPDLIIETGVARGGSILFNASMLELIGGDGLVVGIDIDIREHNRKEIEAHPMFKRVKMIEGSSVSQDVVTQVRTLAKGKKKILVILDSNHTHEHALAEMELYHDLVSIGSYLLVFDTIIEDMPPTFSDGKPWNVGDNPKTAVHEFLKTHSNFIIEKEVQNKLLITVAPDGYLKRIK